VGTGLLDEFLWVKLVVSQAVLLKRALRRTLLNMMVRWLVPDLGWDFLLWIGFQPTR